MTMTLTKHLNASLHVAQMLPGVHRVSKDHRDGSVSVYWYAWRGGPRILKATAGSDALLAKEIARLLPAAIASREALRRPRENASLYGLITRYLDTPAFAALADRTRKDRRKFLDFARTELGEMELRALEARGARKLLIDWRDQYQATPKTADERLGALSTVLTWAHNKGEITLNPVADFPRIYACNRAEMVWLPKDLARLYPHCGPALSHAVRLATLTGLRLGDLIKLPWSAVGANSIVWQTGKSRGRRTVIIPVTAELRKLLNHIPKQASVTILNSTRGRPWMATGLSTAWRLARIDAGMGDCGLRFHDLRGTAATNFIRDGLGLGEIATILGWEPGRVEQISARYVTAEAIGLAMVERLRKNAAKTKTVKLGVKSGARATQTGS